MMMKFLLFVSLVIALFSASIFSNAQNTDHEKSSGQPKTDQLDDSNKAEEIKTKMAAPKHVALIVGCHSHAMLHNHMVHTLQNEASIPNKYRVSYVTGAQCRDIPERIEGVNIFDTGVWYYPSKDPNISGAEYVVNYTRGEILYPTQALEKLIEQDRPDLIISDNICLATGTIAQKHDIPFAIAFRPSIPPISMHAEGYNLGLGFTFNHIPDPSRPEWYFKLCAAYWYRVLISLFWLFTRNAVGVFEQLRQELNKPVFDNIFHVTNSYPLIAYFDDQILARKDIHPKLTNVGLLPHEPDKLSRVNPDLLNFIENSPKPILYVSIGTRNTFSDAETVILKRVFESQELFNVVWAHRTWNYDIMEDIDQSRLFVQAKVAQRDILSHPKVVAFLSHCATGGFTEGISRDKVFIAAPQRGDHFYLAEVIRKRQLGVVVSSEPSETEIRAAIEDVFNNLETYKQNVKVLRMSLSENSVGRLEAIVDWLIDQKGAVVFDFEESNVISLKNSLATLGATAAIMVSVPLFIIGYLLKCICGKKQNKIKTK